MKKIITQEQLDLILRMTYEANVPVQAHKGLQDLFASLPVLPANEGASSKETNG